MSALTAGFLLCIGKGKGESGKRKAENGKGKSESGKQKSESGKRKAHANEWAEIYLRTQRVQLRFKRTQCG